MSLNVCPGVISWTAEPFYYPTLCGDASPWGRVSVRKIGRYLLNCQTFCNQTCTDLLLFLQPDFVEWYIIISRSFSWKKWVVVFKVRLGHNEGPKLSWIVMYIFCTADLLAVKLSELMYCYYWPNQLQQSGHVLDSNTLTYSITRHAGRGGGEGGELPPHKAT